MAKTNKPTMSERFINGIVFGGLALGFAELATQFGDGHHGDTDHYNWQLTIAEAGTLIAFGILILKLLLEFSQNRISCKRTPEDNSLITRSQQNPKLISVLIFINVLMTYATLGYGLKQIAIDTRPGFLDTVIDFAPTAATTGTMMATLDRVPAASRAVLAGLRGLFKCDRNPSIAEIEGKEAPTPSTALPR